jgi:hypothetical protein
MPTISHLRRQVRIGEAVEGRGNEPYEHRTRDENRQGVGLSGVLG